MNIPTGDYIIEFLDYKDEVVPGGLMQCESYTQAETRARNMACVIKAQRYRIMRCVYNSDDKQRFEK